MRSSSSRFHLSGGKLVLCDLQGGRDNRGNYVLSDVVICSEAREYGATDLGADGVSNFMHWHQCNEYCRWDWLKCKSAQMHFNATMTTTMDGIFGDYAAACNAVGPTLTDNYTAGPGEPQGAAAGASSAATHTAVEPQEGSAPAAPAAPKLKFCTNCDRYHRVGTICTRTNASSSWVFCQHGCGVRHKPDTQCPKTRKKISDDWIHCQDCYCRHRPETVCPKKRKKISEDWVVCQFGCGVWKHRPGTICRKAPKRQKMDQAGSVE
ncbi:unnamed protein product [Amoebophrya sp. A25]|nr:unnamed protein product [Amoebophrya sp. A25]|eukprot:GSA25T00021944001.1